MTVPLVQRSRRCELVFARKYPCQAGRKRGKMDWQQNQGRKPVHAVWKGWSHVKCLTNSFWGIDIWHRHMWHLSPRISSPWHLGSTWAAAASKVCMQPTLYSAFASANTMIPWRLKPKRVEDVAVPSRAARCKGHWPCGKWNQLEASWDPFAFHGKKNQ